MKRLLAGAVLAGAALGMLPVAAGPRDRTPPALTYRTADGAVLVGAPVDTDVTVVHGTASDRSGIRRVTVTYCTGGRLEGGGWHCTTTPAGRIVTRPAALSCTGTRCEWRAPVPVEPGAYLAFAEATDRAGNVRHGAPREITVI